MTQLLFLGSGSAFTVGGDNFQSNMLLISDDNEKLLIDCGSDVRHSLHSAGFSYKDITDVYISHQHSDHVGGLEYVGISTHFDDSCHAPNLYLSKELACELWEHTLAGGMRSVGGDILYLEDYFTVHKVERNTPYFFWQGIKMNLKRVVHVDNGYYLMPSYALFFDVDGVKVYLTTDTQLRWEFDRDLYYEADIIFHDCETSDHPTSVHAHYRDLKHLPESIKRKIWLYGYQPGTLPSAQEDGFLGFVKPRQSFDFAKIAQQIYLGQSLALLC